jgi:integrase
MARAYRRLSAVEVAKAKKPGLYADGGGLYLNVGNTGAKSWILRYMLRGKARAMGLGPVRLVSLAEAREKAWNCSKQLLDKIDPIESRNAERGDAGRPAASTLSFQECADRFITAHASGWKTGESERNWRNSLGKHAFPVIGSMLGDDIETKHILQIIEPLWTTKTSTARLLLNRMESIFDDIIARGERTSANPARWKGLIENSLADPSLIHVVQHHPSLPYQELPAFMVELRHCQHIGARPLQFTILTAMRSKEVQKTPWSEIDMQARIWTVPPERMKGRRAGGIPHRVPLSDAAIDFLEEMAKIRENDFVFPGRLRGMPVSRHVMLHCLDAMHRSDLTVHGFRSTFRTWAAETTGNQYRQDIVEMALAHTVAAANAAGVEPEMWRTYQHGDLLEARRPLMQAWADFMLSS